MISHFLVDGVHSPASNFYSSPFELDDVWWPTVEHYYQAMKSSYQTDRDEIRRAGSPGAAKRLGRRVTLRPDWDAVKLLIMRSALEKKFATGSQLAEWLLETGDQLLIEGNWWGDTFWGVDDTKGGWNWLGVLLMARRAELRST